MSVPLNQQTKQLLKSISFFHLLSNDILVDIAVTVTVHQFQAGEIIFLDGDPFAGLHLIEKGLVKLYSMSEKGREYVLRVLQAGELCNEVPIIDGGPNPINCQAVEDSTIWIISAKSLEQLQIQHPVLRGIIVRNVAIRCRQLVRQISRLSFLSVPGRLAAFLLNQSKGEDIVARRWTQEELATYLGTVREVVSRAFQDLQRAGLISVNRHEIHILNRARLEELAEI
ncbi:Crp/Fnr family transcriptional regulator [Anaerolineales bacterium HSG6]|nr:Crp/Fnr family transcriptional regulator [Anaerolineales bacterium HSG6]MDM8530962.1 Crp/Fnr family transcriptional regulator [Anaerolineales bacterium HSG25]